MRRALRSIIREHEIGEAAEQQRKDNLHRECFWIILHILGYASGLCNIPVDESIFEFKDVVLFTDTRISLHHIRRNDSIARRHVDIKLLQFARQAVQIRADTFNQHHRGLFLNGKLMRLDMIGNEIRQHIFPQLLRFKDGSSCPLNVACNLLATIQRAVLMAEHKHRRWLGLLKIESKRIYLPFQILSLLDDNDLSFSHHRIAFGEGKNGTQIRVLGIDNCLVEFLFALRQHISCETGGKLVNIVRLIAHQIIDRAEVLISNLLKDVFVRYGCHLTSRTSGA